MSGINELAYARSKELGRIGEYLLDYLPIDADVISGCGISKQIAIVENYASRNDYITALAVNFLLCDVVCQIMLPLSIIQKLVSISFPYNNNIYNKSQYNINLREEREKKFFPLKKVKEAGTKVNLSFSDLYESLLKEDSLLADQIQYISGEMVGLYNDQAAAVILGASCLQRFYKQPAHIALSMIKEPNESKALTIIIKSTGNNCKPEGALIVEGNGLLGKGVQILNLRDEILNRCGQAGLNKTPQLFEDNRLIDAINCVLAIELDNKKVEYDDPDEWWSKRWLWCVNGGHSRMVERHDDKWKVKYKGHVHRRVAMESWEDNPLYNWDGEVWVSAITKEENGKARLVLSTDTVSYACFEHFASAVEKQWNNHRVLLDPGKYGMVGIADRVRKMSKGVHVMVDYTDYNAQHTLRAQQLVVKCVAEYTNYSPEYTRRLIASFEKMHGCLNGQKVGTFSATLMSGHRLTTFINSILNLAYFIAADKDMWTSKMYESLHTGDDVVASFRSIDSVADLFTKLKNAKVQLNPLKQSVGYYSYEFLRLAIGEYEAWGYAMRAVASTISGNWSNDSIPGPSGILMTAISNARSLINRSGSTLPARLMVTSVAHRVGLSKKIVRSFLLGEVSYNHGPTYGNNLKHVDIYEVSSEVKVDFDNDKGDLDAHATASYLSHHVSDIERDVLREQKVSVYQTMLGASYAKSLAERESVFGKLRCTRAPKAMFTNNCEIASVLARKEPIVGILEKYPILVMLKNRLKRSDIANILRRLGILPKSDVMAQAWGPDMQYSLVYNGTLPYGEACSLSKRAYGSVITVLYSINM